MIFLATALFSTASVQPGQAAPLSCSLRTPQADKVEFLIETSVAGLVLKPGANAAWPRADRIASAVATPTKNVTGTPNYLIGTAQSGLALAMEPLAEARLTATIFRLVNGKIGLPVAVGFCSPPGNVAQAKAPEAKRLMPPGGGDSSILSPTRWTGSDCALISATGQEGRIDYTPFAAGGAELGSSTSWPWVGKKSATRTDGGPLAPKQVGRAKFKNRKGLSGTEYLYTLGSYVAHLLYFSKLGIESGEDGPAAAICGYYGIIRRPSQQ